MTPRETALHKAQEIADRTRQPVVAALVGGLTYCLYTHEKFVPGDAKIVHTIEPRRQTDMTEDEEMARYAENIAPSGAHPPLKYPQDYHPKREQSDPNREGSAQWRKERPMYSGLLAYFPDALREVSHCSFVGNEQHNPGEPLHWAREKSTDEPDAMMRHLHDRARGELRDSDGVLHSVKAAWRALALAQKDLENSDVDAK